MKKLTILLFFICSLSFGQDIYNPATIGAANRNQQVSKGFQVPDTLNAKGKFLLPFMVFDNGGSYFKTNHTFDVQGHRLFIGEDGTTYDNGFLSRNNTDTVESLLGNPATGGAAFRTFFLKGDLTYQNNISGLVYNGSQDTFVSIDDKGNLFRTKIGVGVQTVTGDVVDNTDAENPVVKVSDDVTFEELTDLISTNLLVTGVKYIMRFTSIYDQPDFNADGTPKGTVVTKTGSLENLVFTATGTNTLASEVFSIEFPNDKIKFDFSFTQTEVMNAPAKGRISERIDENFNRADYDFRNILFKRYESSTGSGLFSSWRDNGEDSQEFLTFSGPAALYNDLGNFAAVAPFLGDAFILPNIVFQNIALDNHFNSGNRNFTFLNICSALKTGSDIQDITVFLGSVGGFSYNYIGGFSNGITFLGDAHENDFFNAITNCTFGDSCNDNSIWDKMTNVTTGRNFIRNIQYGNWMNSTIGDYFTDAVVYGIVDSITAGNNNFKIEIKSGSAITIGNNNSNIAFGGTKHILPLNDINGVRNVSFGGSIDGYGWTTGITAGSHSEFYTPATKNVVFGTDGNIYSIFFDGSGYANSVIN